MTGRVHVHVTADDIQGASSTSANCPIARAIRREYNVQDVFVHPYDSMLIRVGDLIYLFSRRALTFALRYDNWREEPSREEPKPGTFYLRRRGLFK
jgi:hypothetical protein